MKFDYIVGNPPYQVSDGGASASAKPVYNYFVDSSKELTRNEFCLIFPARWYAGGKGLNDFRKSILKDRHVKKLIDYKKPDDVFPNTNIRGGVCVLLWDSHFDNSKSGVEVVTVEDKKTSIIHNRKLDPFNTGVFIRDFQSLSILNKVSNNNFESLMDHISSRKPFGLGGTFVKTSRFCRTKNGLKNPVKIYGKQAVGYTELENVLNSGEWIDNIKVFTTRANNIGTELNDDNLNAFVALKKSACTETYIVIGANDDLTEESASNIVKYLKTKFCRFLISLAKSSQDATRGTYKFVPIQDFSTSSNIDWSNSISEIDQQLYKKYGLNDNEIKFIETHIKEMA
ncbi:Eco57I restriction-modification methylase domain-containing protein [Limosilactobacillus allomucosae]|uniref:Eco57I restriction-modification methylase domain-containing protein n=1 Tax=Limosilactobacillus allomucosae TaxID=3142938 RepID=A0ABV0I7H0_9LACO